MLSPALQHARNMPVANLLSPIDMSRVCAAHQLDAIARFAALKMKDALLLMIVYAHLSSPYG